MLDVVWLPYDFRSIRCALIYGMYDLFRQELREFYYALRVNEGEESSRAAMHIDAWQPAIGRLNTSR